MGTHYDGSGRIHLVDIDRVVVRDQSKSMGLRLAGKVGLAFSGARNIDLNIDDPPREVISGDVTPWIRRSGAALKHRLSAKLQEPSVSIHHYTTTGMQWLMGLALIGLWAVGLISFGILMLPSNKRSIDETWLWAGGIIGVFGLISAIFVLYPRRGRLLIEFNPRQVRIIEDKVTYQASDITRIVVNRWAMYWSTHANGSARLGLRFKLLMKSGDWIELPAFCGYLGEKKLIAAIQSLNAYRLEYDHARIQRTPLTDRIVGKPKYPEPWKDSERKALEKE